MWVEKTNNGKYRYSERYTDPLTMKQKKVSITLDKDTASARKDAVYLLRKKIDEKMEKESAGLVQDADKLTFGQLVDLYLKDQRGKLKESTYRRNEVVANILVGLLGRDTLVARLNAPYCRDRIATKNCKPATINERYTRFKTIIRWAYKNELIADIRFIDKLEKVKDQRAKDKLAVKYFESDELKAFLDFLNVKKWRDLSEFLALSGLRIGEALALTLDDINMEEKYFSVDKTYDFANNITTSPKTETSNRDVFMQPELYTLVARLRKSALEKRLKYGHHSNLLFCDANGDHYQYYAYNKYLREQGRKFGCETVTPHYFRHTHASLLAEAGVPLETIMRRLGHENSNVTKQVYIHATQKLKEKDAEAIARVSMLS